VASNTIPQSTQPGEKEGRDKPVEVGDTFQSKRLDTPLDRLTRQGAGRRSVTRTERKRGRYVKSRPAGDKPDDIAFDATLRSAAIHQRQRKAEASQRGESGRALELRKYDLQRKVRVRRASNLILFVVDASWSMAAAERMEATKGAIMSLLMDAYQRRDQVGLVVFQKDRARLVLPPTSSVDLAHRALSNIPVGGKTPLSHGLLLAYRICEGARRRDPETRPLIILLTDGAGNVSMTGMPAQDEAMHMAKLIEQANMRSVVVNMEHVAFDRGLAQALADAMGAPCYCLPDLAAESLVQTVHDGLQLSKS
jgi:magnesium chelatase subunit D